MANKGSGRGPGRGKKSSRKQREPAPGGPFRGELPHPRVHISGKRLHRHPWVMKGQIAGWDKEVVVGEPVCFLDKGGYYIGSGFFHPRSNVQGRILSEDPAARLDPDWLEASLERAWTLRERLGIPQQSDAFRLVNSEGDSLSGLIIDMYGDVAVVQLRSLGFFRWRKALVKALRNLFGEELEVLVLTEEASARIEGIQLPAQTCAPRTITEHGVRFAVDFETGHKTGFFLDQRPNRKRVAELAEGRHLLDICCYTGGFGVTAAALGKPASVTGVDLDEKALVVAKENGQLNEVDIDWVHADAFRFLKDLREKEHRFDLMVLDPPKFARKKSELKRAEQTLIDLNKHALAASRDQSWFVTCSCSGPISRERFAELVRHAARRSGRSVQVLEGRGPGADHPVAINYPEGNYLNVLVCWVRTIAA